MIAKKSRALEQKARVYFQITRVKNLEHARSAEIHACRASNTHASQKYARVGRRTRAFPEKTRASKTLHARKIRERACSAEIGRVLREDARAFSESPRVEHSARA